MESSFIIRNSLTFSQLVSVMETMGMDREFLVYSYWLTTVSCLTLSLLFAAVSAVFAVINTATTPIAALTGVPGLYLWNFATRKYSKPAVISQDE